MADAPTSYPNWWKASRCEPCSITVRCPCAAGKSGVAGSGDAGGQPFDGHLGATGDGFDRPALRRLFDGKTDGGVAQRQRRQPARISDWNGHRHRDERGGSGGQEDVVGCGFGTEHDRRNRLVVLESQRHGNLVSLVRPERTGLRLRRRSPGETAGGLAAANPDQALRHRPQRRSAPEHRLDAAWDSGQSAGRHRRARPLLFGFGQGGGNLR